jgi:hypothetical protein
MAPFVTFVALNAIKRAASNRDRAKENVPRKKH